MQILQRVVVRGQLIQWYDFHLLTSVAIGDNSLPTHLVSSFSTYVYVMLTLTLICIKIVDDSVKGRVYIMGARQSSIGNEYTGGAKRSAVS